MALKDRVHRADRMTVELPQEAAVDAIVIAAGDTYYHSSTRGRLPLTKKGDKFFYQADGSQLKALHTYIVKVNKEHAP